MLELADVGVLSAAVLGRMWDALMFVTSDWAVLEVGGLAGTAGLSRAAARQDMARPSVESELAAVSWGSGGSGLLDLTGEGTTGGVAAPLLAPALLAPLLAPPLLGSLLGALLGPLLAVLLAPLLGALGGAAAAPAVTTTDSVSLLTELVDLLESCLIRVPDSRGSVNCVVL